MKAYPVSKSPAINSITTHSVASIVRKADLCTLAIAFVFGGWLLIAAPTARAQTVTVLRTFGNSTDGQNPYGGLIESGNALYGVTAEGGTGTCPSPGTTGCGTVFTISSKGYKVLWSFKGPPSDGAGPGYENLVTDGKGTFYGTTVGGGTGPCKSNGVVVGCGTVFKITSTGTETVLWNFAGPPNDGAIPNGGLAIDSSGNLYGTTLVGGNGSCSGSTGSGCGTVFEVTSTGTENVRYNFKNLADGITPFSGLVLDPAGNLYGTTTEGGTGDAGTVFEVTPSGSKTILHSFSLGQLAGGVLPYGGLVRDSAGNLYGTAAGGGASCSCGIVFELSGTTFKIMYAFAGAPTDGASPYATLLRDSKGNLYGTTVAGGANDAGAVFEIPIGGAEKMLASLNGTTQGNQPFGSIWTSGPNADLYGTAGYGGNAKCTTGAGGCGTLFRVAP
jgi:uncharacterized repeat protein (TIGR03803 family)